jgi:anti-sigma regulatory factor (Ser/Thr protein kinase)
MPSDWWDSPAVAACPLGAGAQSGRTARKFTRTTLKEWELVSLADDAEAIVGEFVANAVSHAAYAARSAESGQPLGLRLLRRTGEVMCAVLDPSDIAPVLRMPDRNEEAGRGLQMVDALSDVWGWSPVTGRGKAVWAILFCALSACSAPYRHGQRSPEDLRPWRLKTYGPGVVAAEPSGLPSVSTRTVLVSNSGRPPTDALDLAVRKGRRHRDHPR